MGDRRQVAAAQSAGKTVQVVTNQELLDRVRQRIRARGARGIIGIGKSFKIIDDDRSGSLENEEFSKCLRDYRISTDIQEHKAIFELFDCDRNGSISYDEFLRAIVGDMNPRRQALALRAFRIIDKDGSGVLEISDVKGVYNAKRHPDVLSGKQSEDDVLFEFLDTFESHYAIRNGETSTRDGKVT